MKLRTVFFIGTISGIILALLAFLLYSSIVINWGSLLIGFIASIILSTVFFLLSPNKFNNNSDSLKKRSTLVFSVILICFGLMACYLIFDHQEIRKSYAEKEQIKLAQQAALTDAIRQGNLVSLMSNILNKASQELEKDANRTLSEQTITQIVTLNYSFKPYHYLNDGKLSKHKLSPERGQLLLALLNLNIDSSTIENIFFRTSFEGADLSGAKLYGRQLEGIDLNGANLQDADLRYINLGNANLRNANLSGANLSEANLEQINLIRADLSWANLEKVNLSNALLNGAKLNAVKMNKANLSNAEIRWADLGNAFLEESQFPGVNLYGTNLEAAILRNANLDGANLLFSILRNTNFENANLSQVNLIKAGVKEINWLEKLQKWEVIGVKDIKETYKVIEDGSKRTEYMLLKK